MSAPPTPEHKILDVREQIARIDDWMLRIHAESGATRLSAGQIAGVVAGGGATLLAIGALFGKLLAG